MSLRRTVSSHCAFLLVLLLAIPLHGVADQKKKESIVYADKVIGFKAKRELQLLKGEEVLRTYKVALGTEPVGPKTRQGDHRTPEGNYILDFRNANSQFYKSIHITYPNAADRAQARKRRVSPGGSIMIHGLPNGWAKIGKMHLLRDWTDGCIAVTNEEMDEIWKLVRDGTPIEIKP
ncbi:MAG: L,D-transpeptidase family protein [Acidobacteria bacterium]|nr:L,D-transpeptidase family protein [Acidobacteriota bacterium]